MSNLDRKGKQMGLKTSKHSVELFNGKDGVNWTNQKKQYYRISPELSDGQHWSIVETKECLLEAIGEWLDSGPVESESFKVEIVEMSDDEVEALPVL
jgi:hypothetical protein